MANKLFSSSAVPVGLVQAKSPPRRVPRRPSNPFNIHQKAYAITPFFAAPVLAGETITGLQCIARAVSDQVKNPIVGARLEYHFFTVPLRLLSSYLDTPEQNVGTKGTLTSVESMLLDQSTPITTATGAPAVGEHGTIGAAPWIKLALDAVTDAFFRDDKEAIAIATLTAYDGSTALPMAKVSGNDWTHSVFKDTEIADETVDIDATPTPDNFSIEEMDGIYQTWLLMRSQNMTEMTYEDYKATFGVKSEGNLQGMKVERIYSTSNWAYPVNTVNPSDVLDGADAVVVPAGTPSAAFSFSTSATAKKRLFVTDPSIIIGVSVFRPKLYLGRQAHHAVGMLTDALSWMPAVYAENVEMSLRKYANATGPLGGTGGRDTNGYYVDLRDLFIYGAQFTDAAHNSGLIADTTKLSFEFLPMHSRAHEDNEHEYNRFPDADDISNLFVDSAKQFLHQDGTVDLTILGTQVDHTK